MQEHLVSHFTIRQYRYHKYHTTGALHTFRRPCIGYMTKGRAEILYQGKLWEAKAGDLIYIAAETRYYSFWYGEPEVELYSISFELGSPYALLDYRFQIFPYGKEEVFATMMEQYEKDPFRALAAFYQLLSEIYPEMYRETYDASMLSMIPAIRYLEEHYQEPVTVRQLAELCNCSESYFFHRFRVYTGVSPIVYKQNVQIQHALELLTYTNLRIEEISERTGFSSSNYFRTVLRKLTGKSPKELRRKK